MTIKSNRFLSISQQIKKKYPEAYELLVSLMLYRRLAHFLLIGKKLNYLGNGCNLFLEAFNDERSPLHFYPAGNDGPAASNHLLEDDWFK